MTRCAASSRRSTRDNASRAEVRIEEAPEIALYDALVGTAEDTKPDRQLAKIAYELVASIRADLSVDWTRRESAEAQSGGESSGSYATTDTSPPRIGTGNGHGLDRATDMILEQARVLYAHWPEDLALNG